MFAGTSIKRIGRNRFLRNVLIAIGNSADPGLIKSARNCLDDRSPLVRATAVWALARLAGSVAESERANRQRSESDPIVQAEWTRLNGGA
jgi:epoxyqueuosine reductase